MATKSKTNPSSLSTFLSSLTKNTTNAMEQANKSLKTLKEKQRKQLQAQKNAKTKAQLQKIKLQLKALDKQIKAQESSLSTVKNEEKKNRALKKVLSQFEKDWKAQLKKPAVKSKPVATEQPQPNDTQLEYAVEEAF